MQYYSNCYLLHSSHLHVIVLSNLPYHISSALFKGLLSNLQFMLNHHQQINVQENDTIGFSCSQCLICFDTIAHEHLFFLLKPATLSSSNSFEPLDLLRNIDSIESYYKPTIIRKYIYTTYSSSWIMRY